LFGIIEKEIEHGSCGFMHGLVLLVFTEPTDFQRHVFGLLGPRCT